MEVCKERDRVSIENRQHEKAERELFEAQSSLQSSSVRQRQMSQEIAQLKSQLETEVAKKKKVRSIRKEKRRGTH